MTAYLVDVVLIALAVGCYLGAARRVDKLEPTDRVVGEIVVLVIIVALCVAALLR